jgi:ABC-type dipeptide/oligopeptide/nickel transport system ATPase subunit
VNWHHESFRGLVTGCSGSGKSTLWWRLINQRKADWRFYFDREGELEHRFKLPVCFDMPQMVRQLAKHRLVVFNPHVRFRRRTEEAFDFFCLWAWHVSETLPGVKLLATDEFEKCVDGRKEPGGGLVDVFDTGRKRQLDCLFAAQAIGDLHYKIRKQLTHVYCLRQIDRLPLAWLEEPPISLSPQTVSSLPYPGGYILKNLITGECTTHTPRAGNSRAAVAGKKA